MFFTSALSRQSPSNGTNSLLLTLWLAMLFQCNLNAGAFAFQFQINNSMNVRMRIPSRTFRYMKMSTTKVIPQTATSAFALNGARTSVSTCTRTRTELRMGIFDFFQSREDDFIKLDPSSESTIGPGPLILFYNIPHGIDDEELAAMVEDGAPTASRVKKDGNGNGKIGVAFERIYPLQVRDGIYSDKSVIEVLQMIDNGNDNSNDNGNGNGDPDPSSVPILYFSGISNSEMMKTYNIIAKEIYEETGGTANAACAKVVEPAFGKSFRQLVEEISGDHADAMTVKE